MKTLVLVATVLAFSALGFAETPSTDSVHPPREAAAGHAPQIATQALSGKNFSSADCVFTFTSGSGNTFLKFCVTANGNVTLMESPEGQEHIAIGKDGEGYGVCDEKSGVAYDDYAEYGDSGNWDPPTVLSQNSTSVKIARTTSDGFWTLTQTFTQLAGASPSVKIAMSLTNNTTVSRTAILVRYADVDADGLSQNNLDETILSAFAWNSAGITNPFGLVLQNVGNASGAFIRGVARDIPDPPSPCAPVDHEVVGPATATDGSILMLYGLKVPKNTSKTVTVRYRGF